MAAMRSGPSTVPVGLAGELMTMALVCGLSWARHGLWPELEGIASSTGT